MHGMGEGWGGGPYIVVVCIECQGGDYAWDGGRMRRRAIHSGGMHRVQGGDYAWEERGEGGPYLVVVCIECQGVDYTWGRGGGYPLDFVLYLYYHPVKKRYT